jgi:hypothetical protein
LTIVLFHMAGVLAGILAGWSGEGEVAVLYAAQQAILTRFRKHVRDLAESKSAKAEPVQQFDSSLAELCVYRLQKQIESNRAANVNIPIVPKQSILLNAEKASFASVIAPYQLLQTKHASAPNEAVAVDLEQELRSCCLLKNCQSDSVIRGLIGLWNGDFEELLPD